MVFTALSCLILLAWGAADKMILSNVCSCSQIQNERDCIQIKKCTWVTFIAANSLRGSCQVLSRQTFTPSSTSEYCSKITNSSKCAQTLGCAWSGSLCAVFSGCTAYTKKSHSDCKAVNTRCSYNGLQCVEIQKCREYFDQQTCEVTSSLSGTGKCLWENGICRDQLCPDAPKSFSSDKACSDWHVDCITIGRGCANSLSPCASYIGDDVSCLGYIGEDGMCQGRKGGLQCYPKSCEDAPKSFKTNIECAGYQFKCITTGKGCVSPPLPSCASYKGDENTCAGYTGSEGRCQGDPQGLNCRARLCQSAPLNFNTDQSCDQYRSGCLTNGVGCVSFRETCSHYFGSDLECRKFIGSNGYCRGSSQPEVCTPIECAEAPILLTTDSACESYQRGCVTNGRGCVPFLLPCSAYSGTQLSCGQYKGSDGKCRGLELENENQCIRRSCGEVTDTGDVAILRCQEYQYGCRYDGFACLPSLGCSDIQEQRSCQALSECDWNYQCLNSEFCANFSSPFLCSRYIASRVQGNTVISTRCIWEGQACRELLCSDAPQSFDSDALCDAFLQGCVTNGAGCIDRSRPCSMYRGTGEYCRNIGSMCGNTAAADSTTPCQVRTCAHNITSTSDQACSLFKSGCITKGIGCIEATEPCSAYFGTITECSFFRGENGTKPCWGLSSMVGNPCLNRLCVHGPATLASDEACQSFLSGCVTNGAGCISSQTTCASYVGTLDCSLFDGRKCISIKFCKRRECSDVVSPQINSDCQNYLGKCRLVAGQCIESSSCNSYSGDALSKCSSLTSSSGQACWWSSGGFCRDRICSDATGVTNRADCDSFLAGCLFDGSGCIAIKSCDQYNARGQIQSEKSQYCLLLMDSGGNACKYQEGDYCSYQSLICSADQCQKYQNDTACNGCTECQWNGLNCQVRKSCSDYVVRALSDADNLLICSTLKSTTGEPCLVPTGTTNYSATRQCGSRRCMDKQGPNSDLSCRQWKSSCMYVGMNGKCYEFSDQCSYPLNAAYNTSLRQTICGILNDGFTSCQYSSGLLCERLSCAGKTDATNTATCDSWKPGCILSQSGLPCIQQSPLCDYEIHPSLVTPTDIFNYCVSNKCYYLSGTKCSQRLCSQKTAPSDQSDCSTWKVGCKFAGLAYSCVDLQESCLYNIPPSAPDYSVYCQTLGCQYATGNVCSPRRCDGLTAPSNQAACNVWKNECAFISAANPCKDYHQLCALITIPGANIASQTQSTYCEAVASHLGFPVQCQFNSGTYCSQRQCSRVASPSVENCRNWRSGCHYVSTAQPCIDYQIDCLYAIPPEIVSDSDKSQYCNSIPVYYDNELSYQIKCHFISGSKCQLRKCSDLTNVASMTDCTNWKAHCFFIFAGVACQEYSASCNYDLPSSAQYDSDRRKICESIPRLSADSAVCQYNHTTSKCELRGCESKIFPQSQAECDAWASSCVFIQVGTPCQTYSVSCAYNIPSSITNQRSFCERLSDCQYTSGLTCSVRVCSGKLNPVDQYDCEAWQTTCGFVVESGTPKCVDGLGFCSTVNVSPGNESSCITATFSTIYNAINVLVNCQYIQGSTCSPRLCSGKANPVDQNDCTSWKQGCTFITNGHPCVKLSEDCNYPALGSTDAEKIANCQSLQCSHISGFATCSRRKCSEKTNATSIQDCRNFHSSCRWLGGTSTCVDALPTCDYIINSSVDITSVYSLCQGLTTIEGEQCQQLQGKTCQSASTCGLIAVPTSNNFCLLRNANCRFDGSACIDAQSSCGYVLNGAISSGTVQEKFDFCFQLTTNTSPPIQCTYVSGPSCTSRTCNNISHAAASTTDCQTLKATCIWTGTVCIEAGPCSGYNAVGGSDSIKRSYCNQLIDDANPSNPCTFTDGSSFCETLTCLHNASGTTNSVCQAFKTGCKTNGTGCVAIATTCSTFTNQIFPCESFLSENGIDFCITDIQNSSACLPKSCASAGNVSTNEGCRQFYRGCVTNGAMCVSEEAPCNSYFGTQAQCAAFKGNHKKCWNTAAATSATPCFEMSCSDDTITSNDQGCASQIANCVTKGVGCIEVDAPCESYKGTQLQCSAFKGSNGTKLCWNTETATSLTPCIERTCQSNTTATSDSECDSFLPAELGSNTQRCVTNGSGCIPSPALCAQFIGDAKKCSTYTASDGPCKSSALNGFASCTPRVCSEAPQSNNTNEQCKSYHPSCVTNSHGCISSRECNSQFRQDSCQAVIGCTWISYCKEKLSECSQFTTFGANSCLSAIVPTGTKRCSWSEQNCRAQRCDELPQSLVTHLECNNVWTECTTSGVGCIQLGECASYLTEGICAVAETTQPQKFCVWDLILGCRPRECSDFSSEFVTDQSCDNFLKNCKSNGLHCIAPNFDCQDLLTQNACINDSRQRPCLWFKGSCLYYSRCEDLPFKTHLECSEFSQQCTSNGSNCIPISTCQLTKLEISCVRGTDGSCYWSSAQLSCKQFTKCDDLVSSSNETCSDHSIKCISDGMKCIQKADCASYQTEAACKAGGTDGVCFYSQNKCRLRECSDANRDDLQGQPTILQGCGSFIAKTKCTTDGTKCIALKDCEQYSQQSCYLGINGECIWEVQATTNGQANMGIGCRLKVCSDVNDFEAETCSRLQGCHFDGQKCVKLAECVSYSARQACNLGGLDGVCVFSPSSVANIGTCKLMKTCEDANEDLHACSLKKEACVWDPESPGSHCKAQTCSSKAKGDQCHPVPSVDGQYSTICVKGQDGGCVEGSGLTLPKKDCSSYTDNIFFWNEQASQCEPCVTGFYCGDLVTTSALLEECDDGNQTSGDGCSAICQVEPGFQCLSNTCWVKKYFKPIIQTQSPTSNFENIRSFQISFSVPLPSTLDLAETVVVSASFLQRAQAKMIQNSMSSNSPGFSYLELAISLELEHTVTDETVNFEFTRTQEMVGPNNEKLEESIYSAAVYDYFQVSEPTIIATTNLTIVNNSILYILLGLVAISILFGGLDAFWNLLDLVQFLSYLIYINTQLPYNLTKLLETFEFAQFKYLNNFFQFQQDINQYLNGLLANFSEESRPLRGKSVNGFFLINIQSVVYVVLITFCIKVAAKIIIPLAERLLNIKITNRVRLYFVKAVKLALQQLRKYQESFYWSVLIRTHMATAYEVNFAIFLSLFAGKFELNEKPLIITCSYYLSFTALLVQFWLIFQYFQKAFLINSHHLTVSYAKECGDALFESLETSKIGTPTSYFNLVLLIKRIVYVVTMIEFFNTPIAQAAIFTALNFSQISFLLSKRPLKSQVEFIKQVISEILMLSLNFQLGLFVLDDQFRVFEASGRLLVGWFSVGTITIMMICQLCLDLVQVLQQNQRIFRRILNIKGLFQKTRPPKLNILELSSGWI